MFGWFSPKCPVNEESREWVERRFAWVCQTFGPERVRTARAILPTPEFFPGEYDKTEAAGRHIFDRVCDYAGVARSRVELIFTESRPSARFDAISLRSDEPGALGTYIQAGAGAFRREIITIDRDNLRDPIALVATAAHELCHVHLLGDGRVAREEEDHEPLTDLLTVCLGMGIFGANAAVRDSAWSDAAMHGWSVSRAGYLKQETWAYALALFARYRDEPRPDWLKHLRPDVRSAFRSGERYLSGR